jgi:hypothetical protein
MSLLNAVRRGFRYIWNIGVTPDIRPEEAKHIRYTNIFAFLLCATSIAAFIQGIAVEKIPIIIPIANISASALSLVVYALNRSGRHNLPVPGQLRFSPVYMPLERQGSCGSLFSIYPHRLFFFAAFLEQYVQSVDHSRAQENAAMGYVETKDLLCRQFDRQKEFASQGYRPVVITRDGPVPSATITEKQVVLQVRWQGCFEEALDKRTSGYHVVPRRNNHRTLFHAFGRE